MTRRYFRSGSRAIKVQTAEFDKKEKKKETFEQDKLHVSAVKRAVSDFRVHVSYDYNECGIVIIIIIYYTHYTVLPTREQCYT